MSDDFLRSLIGKSKEDAVLAIGDIGWEAYVFHKNTIRPLLALPSYVVEINHDSSDLVVYAYTQESIDRGFCAGKP